MSLGNALGYARGGVIGITTLLNGQAFSDFNHEMQNIGTNMKIIGRDFLIAGGAMSIPFIQGAKAAVQGITTMRAFGAVFGENKQHAMDFATTLASSTGRSVELIKQSMTSVQALFKGLGFKGDAFDLTKQTQSLMTDLAAFRGLTDDDVMARFVSTLSGGVEAMDQLGIDVHEHTVQLELNRMGIRKHVQDATEQEKILARLHIIHNALASQGGIGAATRALSELDGKVVQLNSRWEELTKTLGDNLIPVLDNLVESATAGVEIMDEFASKNPGITNTFAEMAIAISSLGTALWGIGAATRVAGFGLSWLKAVPAPLALLGVGAVSAGYLIGNLINEIRNLGQATPPVVAEVEDLGNAVQRALTDREIQRMRELKHEALALNEAMAKREGDWGFDEMLKRIQHEMNTIMAREWIDPATIADPIAEGMEDGARKGWNSVFTITNSALSQRMFANMRNAISDAIDDPNQHRRRMSRDEFRARQDAERKEEIQNQINQISQGMQQREDALTRDTPEDVRDRVHELRERDLARINALGREYESIRQREQQRAAAPEELERDRERARRAWENYDRPGPGANPFGSGGFGGASPGYQDPGAYIMMDNGKAEFYRERDDFTAIPDYLKQGAYPEPPPETAPTETTPRGPGPYYVDAATGEFMRGPSAGATTYPTQLRPEDMPAFGGFGGAGKPADPYAEEPRYRTNEADIKLQEQIDVLKEMRDIFIDIQTYLSSPDIRDGNTLRWE